MRRAATLILWGVVMLACGGCGSSVPSSNSDARVEDSHALMLALLDKVKTQAAQWHPYLGHKELDDARSDLAAMPEDAPDNARIRLLIRIGNLELTHGETGRAIKTLTSAVQRARAGTPQPSLELLEIACFRLAVAELRRAETENCVHCQNGESCLLPIPSGGIHTQPAGSRAAIEQLLRVLELNPDHLAARWLLNVACMTVGDYPEHVPAQFLIAPSCFESDAPFPRFANVAGALGLDTFSLSGGAIVDDFDNDGLLDVVTSSWDPAGPLQFFQHNRDGTFRERTADAGLTGILGGLNLLQADYDNDGDLDILVLRGAWLNDAGRHPNSLLRNDGRGVFRDVTYLVGLATELYPSQTAAWADFDHDGDLDLYVGNEGFPCQLFEQRDGRFFDVAQHAGVTNGQVAKGVSWGDYDGDGFPDLYVSNLDGPNRLYHNLRNGKFTDVAQRVGVANPERSFPCWFWDFNNDGALDLFVSSYQTSMEYFVADYVGLPHGYACDHLYQGDGRGGFKNVADTQHVARITLAMGSNYGDLDNDGFSDFYLGTGYPEYEALIPNRMYHNLGGTGFAEVSAAGGFSHLQKGHGVCFADIDNDGDQDVFIEMGGAYLGDAFANALFENPGFGHHWIHVRLVGKESNRSAIGARIRVEIDDHDGRRSIFQWVNSGGSFGANPLRREIGLGKATRIRTLEVFWPKTGKTQQFRDVAVDQSIEITEGAAEFRRLNLPAVRFPRG